MPTLSLLRLSYFIWFPFKDMNWAFFQKKKKKKTSCININTVSKKGSASISSPQSSDGHHCFMNE